MEQSGLITQRSEVQILLAQPEHSTKAFKERFLKAYFIGKLPSYSTARYKETDIDIQGKTGEHTGAPGFPCC